MRTFFIICVSASICLLFFWYYYQYYLEPFVSSAGRYRLGDIFNNRIKINKEYLDLHKNTIGYEYVKTKNKQKDYNTLKNICDKRKHTLNIVPKDTELIIHLRLGDVIEMSKYTVDEHLEKDRTSEGPTIAPGPLYIRSREYFEKYLLKEIKTQPIDTIVLTGGDHRALESLEKSNEYIRKVADIFKKYGYNTIIRFNEYTADEDFLYLSNSKYFAPTGGGYGHLAGEIVKLNNNTVYDKYICGNYKKYYKTIEEFKV